MSELNNVMDGTPTPAAEEKTFTMAEVEKIIQDRLDRGNPNPEPEEKETLLLEREAELAQKEFGIRAKEIMEEKKIPVELLPILNATNEEGLIHALEVLDKGLGLANRNLFIEQPDGLFKRYEQGDPITGDLLVDTGEMQLMGTPKQKPNVRTAPVDAIRQAMGLRG